MKCDFCHKDFEEKDIQDSHNVPCYLFQGNRQARKNQADKFLRHWLCKECHEKYEAKLNSFFIDQAKAFSRGYFND